ncbi:hypothetical protein BT93_H1658 [Corymbia citriodora subsp. variegata]|nr:hypothetical protein BT93_H1658 [Corymbia citriodora subsp. variegata]
MAVRASVVPDHYSPSTCFFGKTFNKEILTHDKGREGNDSNHEAYLSHQQGTIVRGLPYKFNMLLSHVKLPLLKKREQEKASTFSCGVIFPNFLVTGSQCYGVYFIG